MVLAITSTGALLMLCIEYYVIYSVFYTFRTLISTDASLNCTSLCIC
jgi:hypothetical protein